MALFNLGADIAMTPMGEQIGSGLPKAGKFKTLLLVCFIMGVFVTIAEPDLTVLASQVKEVINGTTLIVAIGVGVGAFLLLSVLRVVFRLSLAQLMTIFYLLFRLMGQYVDAEVKSAIGRADVVVRLADAVYVFEFKYDGTPDEALAQIDSKQYAIPYQADGRKIVRIGVNFDSATRTIGEWKIVE
jgi:hypothetical protein